MPLDTTVGGPTANSYASLVEAKAYHDSRTPALPEWTAASDSQKEAALIQAARLLDGWPRAWTGAAVDSTQALTWPRTGMLSRNGYAILTTVIPSDLKNAQAEFAGQLLAEDRIGDDSVRLQGITDIKAGSVEVTFQQREDPIPRDRVALKRRDSLEIMVPDVVIMLLVASWLKDVRDEDKLYNGLIFQNLGPTS